MSATPISVPTPAPESINTGLHACPTSRLVAKYGHPVAEYTDSCQNATSAFWKARFTTMDVGPFRATGHKRFLEHLKVALADVEKSNPALYAKLGSAGCLCVRRVRGTRSTPSNHALGLAIDITVDGKLDTMGDDETYTDLVALYAVLKRHKIYWGAEFKREDSMHFEASAELVAEWEASKMF